MRGGELHGQPAAERLTSQVGGRDVERVHQAGEVLNVVGQLEVGGGVGGVTVAREVVGDHPVPLGEGRNVMRVRLQLASSAVHQHQRLAVGRPGLQDAGAPRADLDGAQRVLDVAKRYRHGDVGLHRVYSGTVLSERAWVTAKPAIHSGTAS